MARLTFPLLELRRISGLTLPSIGHYTDAMRGGGDADAVKALDRAINSAERFSMLFRSQLRANDNGVFPPHLKETALAMRRGAYQGGTVSVRTSRALWATERPVSSYEDGSRLLDPAEYIASCRHSASHRNDAAAIVASTGIRTRSRPSD